MTYETPQKVWTILEQPCVTFSNKIGQTLATTRKGNMSISEYIVKMKSLVDEMKPIDEEEQVPYILARLDIEFNPMISVLCARVKSICDGPTEFPGDHRRKNQKRERSRKKNEEGRSEEVSFFCIHHKQFNTEFRLIYPNQAQAHLPQLLQRPMANPVHGILPPTS